MTQHRIRAAPRRSSRAAQGRSWLPPPIQAQFDALQKRVAELEKKLASQVAFVKDSDGNLSIEVPGNVLLKGGKLTLKSSADAELVASAALTFKGSLIKLN
jgi:hypothetical protein